jgi:hypothetical protein
MRNKVLWIVWIACAAACSPSRPAPPSLGIRDATEIVRVVREREDGVRTLRATFEATTRRGDELLRTVDGILLVRKPDDFRLRLTMALGLTVFDYLRRADGVRVVYPLDPHDDGTPREAFLPFSEEDLAQIFIRGERAFPGACDGEMRTDELVVDCRNSAHALLREIVIDPGSGRIREERSYRDGELGLVLRNDDYRSTGSADLPYRIVLAYPGTQLEVEIHIYRYEVNPALDERLFEPVRE